MSRPVIDDKTVRRISAGDVNAFSRLYDAYWSYLCATAVTFIHNSEAAKEIVNDIFLKVWAHRDGLRSPVHPYLMTALRNACINYLKRMKIPLEGLDAEMVDFRIGRVETFTPLSYTEVADLVDKVRQVSNTLPKRCREVFSMYFFDGATTAEIAQALGIAHSTARVQLKAALDRIRAVIGPIACFVLFFGQ